MKPRDRPPAPAKRSATFRCPTSARARCTWWDMCLGTLAHCPASPPYVWACRRSGSAGQQVPGGPGSGVVELVVEHLVVPGGGRGELYEAALSGRQVQYLGGTVSRGPGPEQVSPLFEDGRELCPDHMERGAVIGPGVQHPDAHGLAYLYTQRRVEVLVGVTIEDGGVRLVPDHLLVIARATGWPQVQLGLDDQVLLGHLRQPWGVDDNRPVHAVGQVLQDGGSATMVEEDPGVLGAEAVSDRLAGATSFIWPMGMLAAWKSSEWSMSVWLTRVTTNRSPTWPRRVGAGTWPSKVHMSWVTPGATAMTLSSATKVTWWTVLPVAGARAGPKACQPGGGEAL